MWINLISNAIKYSNENGKLTINLNKTDGITVDIIDEGIGMTKMSKKRFFYDSIRLINQEIQLAQD